MNRFNKVNIRSIRDLLCGCLFIIGFNACIFERFSGEVILHNNSDSTIYVYYDCDTVMDKDRPLKVFDTLFYSEKKVIVPPHYRVTEYASSTVISAPEVDSLLKSCPDSTVNLFIISEEAIRNNKWETICSNKMYLQKLRFTIEQLDNVLWQVDYYPSSRLMQR